ncbi:MAG: hypothetical protein QXW79_00290 [Thermoplasmata archaeon]
MNSNNEMNKENLPDVNKTSENFCSYYEQDFNVNLVSRTDPKNSEKIDLPIHSNFNTKECLLNDHSLQEKGSNCDMEKCSQDIHSFLKKSEELLTTETIKSSETDLKEDQACENRKKRGPPKTILANQQKYLAILEREQRMTKKKDKKHVPTKSEWNNSTIRKNDNGVRRMIVGGKIKYFTTKKILEKNCSHLDLKKHESNNAKLIEEQTLVPPTITKKMELYREKIDVETSRKTNCIATKFGEKKIPSKYAKEMEKDVKKQTIKNVKNFSDLRRITTIQNLADNGQIDTNKVSIAELRKLRILQRKREQEEQKKNEANRRESIVQEILKNDKMSKFAKMVALKNLSVNSRRRWLLERKGEKKQNIDNIQDRNILNT